MSLQLLKDKFTKKDYNPLDVYHFLMIHYGYIPFSDFLSMDAGLVDELVEKCNKMDSANRASISRGRM